MAEKNLRDELEALYFEITEDVPGLESAKLAYFKDVCKNNIRLKKELALAKKQAGSLMSELCKIADIVPGCDGVSTEIDNHDVFVHVKLMSDREKDWSERVEELKLENANLKSAFNILDDTIAALIEREKDLHAFMDKTGTSADGSTVHERVKKYVINTEQFMLQRRYDYNNKVRDDSVTIDSLFDKINRLQNEIAVLRDEMRSKELDALKAMFK